MDPLLCRFAERRGLTVIGDQMIAPAAVEEREHRKQTKRWPNWELTNALLLVCDLERETWAACDHLTAPSDFVREGLIAEGVDPSRISVLPYPVASEWFQPVDRSRPNGAVDCRVYRIGELAKSARTSSKSPENWKGNSGL